LLSSDGPKSVQPIATRLGLPGYDHLHHFVSSAAWDDGPLWRVLAKKADTLLGGDGAVLVVDDTALPKKGTASVGVTGQYSGALGKQVNCQCLVSLTLARGEVPVLSDYDYSCQASGPSTQRAAPRPGCRKGHV
jgi:SRSO17 transposase